MIIESLAEELVDIQIDNPYKVLGLIGLLTVLILPGALQVQVKPSTEAILPQGDPVVESLDSLRASLLETQPTWSYTTGETSERKKP